MSHIRLLVNPKIARVAKLLRLYVYWVTHRQKLLLAFVLFGFDVFEGFVIIRAVYYLDVFFCVFPLVLLFVANHLFCFTGRWLRWLLRHRIALKAEHCN